jgi:ankyrin repeat protein
MANGSDDDTVELSSEGECDDCGLLPHTLHSQPTLQALPTIHVQSPPPDSDDLMLATTSGIGTTAQHDAADNKLEPLASLGLSKLLTDYHVPISYRSLTSAIRNGSLQRSSDELHLEGLVDDDYNNFIFFVRQWSTQCDRFTKDKMFWKRVLSCCHDENVSELRELFSVNTLHRRLSYCSCFLMWVLRQYTLEVIKRLLEECCSTDQSDDRLQGQVMTNDDGDLIRSALLTAIEAREKIIYLITVRGLNPYKADTKFGCSPMEVAIENIELVQTLTDTCGVDVNWQNYERGKSALNIAINYNAIKTASFLLNRGARVDSTMFDAFHATPHKYNDHYAALLRHIIKLGQIGYVHSLLVSVAKQRPECRCAIVNAKGKHWESCLHVAVESGMRKRELGESERSALLRMSKSRDLVDLLLSYGASVTTINSDGETALHVAARVDNYLAAELLLQDVSQCEQQLTSREATEDLTPLLAAAAHNSIMFLKHVHIDSHYFAAVDRHRRSVAHLVIQKMYANTDTSWNCLHSAPDVIKHVVRQMQDSNAVSLDWQDCNNNTVLDLAAERGDDDTVDVLLQLSDPTDDTRRSTFHKAAARSKVKTCTAIILLTGGACLKPLTAGNEHTALHIAAQNGCLELVMLLVSKAVDINSQNDHGLTALHVATREGHADIVRFLLNKGTQKDVSSVNISDNAGLTPLHYAAMTNRTNILRYLIEQHGDLLERDILGRNVLDVAIDNGHFEVSCIILQSEHWRQCLHNVSCAYQANLTSDQALLLAVDQTVLQAANTPIEKMIMKMPQLLLYLLNQCVQWKVDTYETLKEIFMDTAEILKSISKNDKCALVHDEPDRVESDVCKLEKHPLLLMVTYKREEIINHPLVAALIKQETRLPLTFHSVFLAIYLCLVVLTTTFIAYSEFPPQVNWTECNFDNYSQFQHQASQRVLKVCIFCFVTICIAIELMQIATMKTKYLRMFKNYHDWFCYISTVLVVCSITPCGTLTSWQWQLSAFCVLALWINVIFLLRRAPSVGFYIFLIQSGVEMFMSIFVILFIFIVAYAFAFHILLQNQAAFASPAEAVIKTAVMLTGEQDFINIFYGNENGEQIFYRKSACAIYMLFVTSVLIVVFNIVVGLIVGNISDLMKDARLLQSKLLVELALDFEQHQQKWLPTCLKKYGKSFSFEKNSENERKKSKLVCRFFSTFLKWLKRVSPTSNGKADQFLMDNTDQLLKNIQQQNSELARIVAALSRDVNDLQQKLTNLNMQR